MEIVTVGLRKPRPAEDARQELAHRPSLHPGSTSENPSDRGSQELHRLDFRPSVESPPPAPRNGTPIGTPYPEGEAATTTGTDRQF